jgi:hypothetical protein
MNSFPLNLNVNEKTNFINMLYENLLSKLRNDIYENIIKENEEDYIDLALWYTKNNVNKKIRKNLIEKIISELESLGWKCKLAYGDTALFIYVNEIPKICY